MFDDLTPFVLALSITFLTLICIAIWNSMTAKVEHKNTFKPEPGPSRTREILSRFNDFYINLEAKDGYIYDTGILPDPKQHIVHALYVGYDESETDDDRDAIERGLIAIVNFQDLVGEEPLKPFLFQSEIVDTDSETVNNFEEIDYKENESISDEEKKYNEFLNKSLKELDDHKLHLKIQNKDDIFEEKE